MPQESALTDPTDGTDRPTGRKPPLSPARLIPLLALLAGLVAFFALGLNRYISLEALRDNREALIAWVAEAGAAAWLVYVAVYAAIVALSIPGAAVMTIAGGFLFGPWLGAALTVVGATVGSTAVFLAARYALADYLHARVSGAIRRMEDGFRANAMSYMLFLRLVPVFPFWLVNLAPAFLGVGLGTYLVATFVGIIPGSVVYSLVGDGLGAVLEAGGEVDLGIIFAPRFLLPILGLAALSLMPAIYRKVRTAKT